MIITDPIYHGAADELDDEHPMAWESVDCILCNQMVHAFNNEHMDEWFETLYGATCFDCFTAHPHRCDLPGPGSEPPEGNPMWHWADLEWVRADIERREAETQAFIAKRYVDGVLQPTIIDNRLRLL